MTSSTNSLHARSGRGRRRSVEGLTLPCFLEVVVQPGTHAAAGLVEQVALLGRAEIELVADVGRGPSLDVAGHDHLVLGRRQIGDRGPHLGDGGVRVDPHARPLPRPGRIDPVAGPAGVVVGPELVGRERRLQGYARRRRAEATDRPHQQHDREHGHEPDQSNRRRRPRIGRSRPRTRTRRAGMSAR